MKTLIFDGSLKKNGDTQALLRELTRHLNGEVKTVSYHSGINPCVDCRYCWHNTGCAIDDEMQGIYAFLENCDNIVLASPIWFASLSGPLLNLISRIQQLWAAKYFQKKELPLKTKKGVLILVGGQPKTAEAPTKSAIAIMQSMNVCGDAEKILSLNTDKIPAEKDPEALQKCREVAEWFNGL